jgi:hypothetical protein
MSLWLWLICGVITYQVYQVIKNLKLPTTIKQPDNNYFNKYSDLLNIHDGSTCPTDKQS